jgi:hypothetical protein
MKRLCFAYYCLIACATIAQNNNEFYNNGAAVYIQAGAEVYVMGDVHNYQATGLLANFGFLEIQGDALSDNLFQQRGTGTTRFINNDVNIGLTQYISGSYAVRGGQGAIGVNDGSFYNLELGNDQGYIWLNGAGNIADVRGAVDFNGPSSPLVNRIITHNPLAIPPNGSGYSATFGLMNTAAGLGNLIDNTVTVNGNSSAVDNGYVQGNLRRAIAPAGGVYGFVLGLEPAGAGLQRGMQYMHMTFGANTYDVVSGYFQTGLDNSFPLSVECSGYIIDYFGGVDHGQWVMSDISGGGTGTQETRVWAQDDNFPAKSIWVVTRNNALSGTADDCGPSPVGLDRAGFTGLGQFGVAGSNILLPAELLTIWADPKTDHIEIGWKVGSEYNLDYYKLQRSENGVDFETIAELNAVGNSQEELTYTFNDYNVGRNVMYYYRYESVDVDLYSETSPIVSGMLKNSSQFTESILLYPNPTNGDVSLEISLEKNSQLGIKVFNSAGQVIEVNEWFASSGNNIFAIRSANWSSGVYIIEINDLMTGETVRKKLIKE